MFWSFLVKVNKLQWPRVTSTEADNQYVKPSLSIWLLQREELPVSAHLQWNCSSFLIKRNKQTYSTEPDNLKARNSFCYNRVILQKMVVESPAHGNGVVVVINQKSASQSQVLPMCRPSSTRMHLPKQHPAQTLQERVLPESVCCWLSQGQRHGTQPEVPDAEEEADPPQQELLSTTHPLK